MKRTADYLAVVFLFTLGTNLLYADPAESGWKKDGPPLEQHFKDMDTNNDGFITKAEFDAEHTKYFQKMDANGDGKLSRDEMRDGHMKTLKKVKDSRFDKADSNNDGKLSRDEVEKMPRLSRRFEEIDTNKDGQVSREELDAVMQRKMGERP